MNFNTAPEAGKAKWLRTTQRAPCLTEPLSPPGVGFTWLWGGGIAREHVWSLKKQGSEHTFPTFCDACSWCSCKAGGWSPEVPQLYLQHPVLPELWVLNTGLRDKAEGSQAWPPPEDQAPPAGVPCLSLTHPCICLILIFFKDFIYLFMRDPERKAETQAEGEAGSPQGDHELSQRQMLNH